MSRAVFRRRIRLSLVLATIAIVSAGAPSAARAAVILFEGTLDPAANPSLTYWDQYIASYTAPLADADGMPFNVAVHTFTVAAAGTVTFDSIGYGSGGFDSVLSLFQGTGGAAAYLHHAYSPPAPGDFSFARDLGAGDYTVAVSMFLNEPCAAGPCFFTGAFDDGFSNLANFDPFRPDPLFYRVEVTTPGSAAPVPEPASLVLTGIGLTVLRFRMRRAKGDMS